MSGPVCGKHASPPGRRTETTSHNGAGQSQITVSRSNSFINISPAQIRSSLPPGAPSATMAALSLRVNVLPQAAASPAGAVQGAVRTRAGQTRWPQRRGCRRCSSPVPPWLVTSPQGASYVPLPSLVLLCTSVSFAQVFPCSRHSVFLHLSLSFQPSVALIPNARRCLVLGLTPLPPVNMKTSPSVWRTQELGVGKGVWT